MTKNLSEKHAILKEKEGSKQTECFDAVGDTISMQMPSARLTVAENNKFRKLFFSWSEIVVLLNIFHRFNMKAPKLCFLAYQ